jgi:hypothetical protein
VSERGAVFTVLGEREGWVEVQSWHPPAVDGQHRIAPACVPLARGLEVVAVSFFVERSVIDPATLSQQDPLQRFGCPADTSETEAEPDSTPPLQSGRPRIRLPRGRGTVLTEYELPAQTRLRWPDGSVAGTVLIPHRYSEAPSPRGEGHCVLALAGEAALPQLSWCAREGDFVERSYQQPPLRTPFDRAGDRARARGIVRQLGVIGRNEDEEAVLDALMNDPETLEMLFEVEERGELPMLEPGSPKATEPERAFNSLGP